MIEYLIDGPLWYFSLAVFCVGVLWQLASIVFAKSKTDLSVARGSATAGAWRNVVSRFIPHREIAPQIRDAGRGWLHVSSWPVCALLVFCSPACAVPGGTPARVWLDANAALGFYNGIPVCIPGPDNSLVTPHAEFGKPVDLDPGRSCGSNPDFYRHADGLPRLCWKVLPSCACCIDLALSCC